MKKKIIDAAARAALLAQAGLTSLYCLLCSSDFVWNNYIRDRHYPHLIGALLRGHGTLSLAVAALAASRLGGRARAAWGGVFGALALAAAAAGWLPARGHDAISLFAAFAAWIPYAAWEFARPAPTASAPKPRAPQSAPVAAAALFWSISYAFARAPEGRVGLAAAAWSAVVALQLFFSAALVLDAVGAACAFTSDAVLWERRARAAALWLGASAAAAWALSNFSISGPSARAYAALACALAGLAFTRQRRESAAQHLPRAAALAGFFALSAAPALGRALFGHFDWNGLGALVVAALAALAAWALAHALAPESKSDSRRRGALWLAGAAVAGLAWTARASAATLAAPMRREGFALQSAIARLREADPALSLARLVLPSPSDGGFYALLQRNTNLPRRAGLASRTMELAGGLPPPPGPKPHIFIIVIDSLRPDYLGAYNPKAFFTPDIDAFARDSIVFRRAFAAYGGTGLSEPSIWAGARLPHMQYPSPFPPMNALEKLVDRAGYRPLITMDVLLSDILEPGKRDGALDARTMGSYKLCATLSELEGRLDKERASGRPLFVYTQPQDVHISVIQREGAKPVDQRAYPGFYAPYSSRVAAMDACFGGFISALKARGIYDDSVIALTADHGDSLGERGMWGHAYTIFPEVMRVPLIVHVPERLRAGRVWNADAAAYLTDLTPTLYSLLGVEPTQRAEPFGRPLLARSAAELSADARPQRVVASSYGPVYGVLYGEGRALTIYDAINRRSYVYDLAADPAGISPREDPSALARARDEIRTSLRDLKKFYGY